MSVGINFHDVRSMTAKEAGDVSWLAIENADKNKIAIFMPLEAAKMLAASWDQYRDFVAPRAEPVLVPIRRVEGY